MAGSSPAEGIEVWLFRAGGDPVRGHAEPARAQRLQHEQAPAATTTKFMIAVTTNTVCQPPIARLDQVRHRHEESRQALRGNREKLRLAVANLGPKLSVQVDGNRLKISPQVRKIRPAKTTNAHGVVPSEPSSQ